ncbi:MAG: hypothetical protein R3E01_15830 [Pirellulaceae bacterium]|nr:hypothetical protein [Planctomycetales bacterium]
MAALRRWADDELRSINGQIEYLLRKALRDAGRWKDESTQSHTPELPLQCPPETNTESTPADDNGRTVQDDQTDERSN